MLDEIKGLGSGLIKFTQRVLKIRHDDAGYISLNGDKQIHCLETAITAGVTATTVAAGHFAVTSHATGKSKIFVSDGSFWQAFSIASSKLAGHVYLGAVAAATTTGAITQLSLNGIADGGTATGIVQPKTPRNVKVTITDANSSILTYSLTIAGKAPDGTTISETFTFADGLTPTGSKIFASITSVTVNSITGDGSGDVLDLGYGSKLGVPVMYGATGLVITNLQCDNVVEAASATDTTNNSFTPTTAPNGSKVFQAWFGYAFPG